MADTIFGMPLDQAQSKYGNASSFSLSDLVPNIYGGVASGYEGILGNQQAQQIGQRANIGGLLGAAAALAQGMGSQGSRRSGVQNVLNALGAGYGVAGNVAQQGLQNFALQQQAANQQLQREKTLRDLQREQTAIGSIDELIKNDPSIDPAMRAYLLNNKDKALEMYVKRRGMQQFLARENQPAQAPTAASPDMAAYNDQMANYKEQMAPYTTSGGETKVIPQAEPVREPTGQLAPGTVETAPVPEPFTGKFGVLPTAPAPAAPKQVSAGHPLDAQIRDADLLVKYYQGEGNDSEQATKYQTIAKNLKDSKKQDVISSNVGKSLGGINPALQPLADALIANAKEMSAAEIQSSIMDIRKKNADFKVGTEKELRNEFNSLPAIKEFSTVETSHRQINAALSNPSAANDLAAATKFMKLLDPGSVVRESELGMAMRATGAFEVVQNYFQKLQNGQVLNPDQRADFKKSAELMFKQASIAKDDLSNKYKNLANSYNVDPNNVVLSGSSSNKNQEPKQPIPQKNKDGWRLSVDKDGNRAYVSPDGLQFEEAK
jgi:hypothetical protein